jgi:type IV pilus assembly protein PilP
MSVQTMNKGRRLGLPLFVTLASLSLSACLFSKQDELQTWMSELRSTMKPTVKPIAEPKKFVPQPYEIRASLDPFTNVRLSQALKQAARLTGTNEALVAPEMNRRKEALEAHPLDAMAMIGSIHKAQKPVALVKVDNLVYQVSVGNYLGQNFGKITQITETSITLREIVQDQTGEWIERIAQLELQERKK